MPTHALTHTACGKKLANALKCDIQLHSSDSTQQQKRKKRRKEKSLGASSPCCPSPFLSPLFHKSKTEPSQHQLPSVTSHSQECHTGKQCEIFSRQRRPESVFKGSGEGGICSQDGFHIIKITLLQHGSF